MTPAYIRHQASFWPETTTLLIPGADDSSAKDGATGCTGCGNALIHRDRRDILYDGLDAQGTCVRCGAVLARRVRAAAERFGRRPIPVHIAV